MVKREMYPPEVKYQAVRMKLDGKPTREILAELGYTEEERTTLYATLKDLFKYTPDEVQYLLDKREMDRLNSFTTKQENP